MPFSRIKLINLSENPYFFICQIGFDIALTDVKAKLKQRWDNVISTLKHCATLKNGSIDVVQRWFNVVSMLDTNIISMLCNVENPTLDFIVSFSTSDYRYLNGDPQCWNDVDPTLRCWQDSIYEKDNSYEHSACNFTNKMKLVGIFQGSC